MELRTIDLARSFGDFDFRADISAEPGEFVCLLGPSGCGKSTALQLIAGILAPDRGSLSLGERDITRMPPWERRIGLVFQDYALFPHMTVYENIAYGLKQKGYKSAKIKSRVEELLDLVQLPGYARRKPEQLSGGEKQRVALARAAAPFPDLLLLDEPLSALDARLRTSLRREIKRIQRETGITTIYVTHDQEEALTLSDRIIVMRDGGIEQEGRPQELYHAPANSFVARFIGNANLLPADMADSEGLENFSPPNKTASPEKAEDRYYFFRPEHTRVCREASKDEDVFRIQMKIRSVEYLGSNYLIEAGDAEISIRAHIDESGFDPADFENGEKSCWFEVDREKVKLIPK